MSEQRQPEALQRARIALEGLATGDAFGEQFFLADFVVAEMVMQRTLPEAPWNFTDDTNMALSIFESLRRFGKIEQDALSRSFTRHFDPFRAYGQGMYRLLCTPEYEENWRQAAQALFGNGSHGNGAAMRVAPLGAYFADDLDKVVEQATLSAEVTHAHPEGIAGAIAVAVAVALAWQTRQQEVEPAEFITQVTAYTPDSEVRAGLRRAARLDFDTDVSKPAGILGNGMKVLAQDTVPFAVWCAAHHLNQFEEALWYTVSGLGDRDTTCAMVGGIVASRVGLENIPPGWAAYREPLPKWPFLFQAK